MTIRLHAAVVAIAAVIVTSVAFGATVPRPQEGGTLNRRLSSDVATLNPVRAAGINERLVIDYLYTPLIRLDRNLRPVPGLATSWTISDGGLRYTFKLDKRATFSDGSRVRAQDVVFTLRKALDPASLAPQIGNSVRDVDIAQTRAPDDLTVEVVVRRVRASQLVEFSRIFVIPEHVYGKGHFSDDFNSIAVGSGPYRFVERQVDERIVLVRRADYWDALPHIEKIVFKVVPDDDTAWNLVRSGALDESYISSDAWFFYSARREFAKTIRFLRFWTFNYNFIAWNGRHPIFQDARVRRAVAMCIPVDRIMADLFHGTARRLTGPFMPGSYAYNPHVPLIPYRPSEAVRLLRDAGWADHNKDGVLDRGAERLAFTMLIESENDSERLQAEMIQTELQKIGIVMTIERMEGTTRMAAVRKGKYDASLLGLDLGPEPEPFGLFHSSRIPEIGMNIGFYRNPVVDTLIEQAETELDTGKRQELFWRLHSVLAADQPFTWTFQVERKWAVRTRVQGIEASAGFGLFRWSPGELAWRLEPAPATRR